MFRKYNKIYPCDFFGLPYIPIVIVIIVPTTCTNGTENSHLLSITFTFGPGPLDIIYDHIRHPIPDINCGAAEW